MRKFKISIIIFIVLLIFSSNVSAEIYFIVTENINLYEKPGENVLDTIDKNYYFSQSYIIEQKDKWFKIDYNDKVGWINNEVLDFNQGKPENLQNNSPKTTSSEESKVEFSFQNVTINQTDVEGYSKLIGEIKANSGQHELVLLGISLYKDDELIDSIDAVVNNVGEEYVSFSRMLELNSDEIENYKIRVIDYM